ncbi:DUF6585 family protein [Streptomyces sp. NPDC001205]
MILPRSSEWADLTHDARELAARYDLGELQSSFPIKVGLRRKSVRRVYVFYAGVVWQDPGAPTEAMRWADVGDWRESTTAHYQNGMYSYTDYSYTLTRTDGVSLKLASTFRDGRMKKPPVDTSGPPQAYACSELCRMVCAHLAETRLPGTLQAVQRGEPQVFGSITLAQDRIEVAGDSLSWGLVEDLGVRKGAFQVTGGGRRRPLSRQVSDIPRFTLMKATAEALFQHHGNLPRIG